LRWHGRELSLVGVGWGPERLASIRSEAKPKPPVPILLLSRAKSHTTAARAPSGPASAPTACFVAAAGSTPLTCPD